MHPQSGAMRTIYLVKSVITQSSHPIYLANIKISSMFKNLENYKKFTSYEECSHEPKYHTGMMFEKASMLAQTAFWPGL
jgi:hypothetical protein